MDPAVAAEADSNALLYVYGTLRQGFDGLMARWLQQKADFQGSGWSRGRLYDAGAYPVMVASGRADDAVRGDVYLLAKPEVMFSRLDRYEGCSPSARPPGEYRRVRLSVAMDDGRMLNTWAISTATRHEASDRFAVATICVIAVTE